jgi:hypothetical protein
MHTDRIKEAVKKKLITKDEGKQLLANWTAMREAIKVDDFTEEEFKGG